MTSTATMSVSSAGGGLGKARSSTSTTPIGRHQHQVHQKHRHHRQQHRVTDYHTEHDTDNRASSPRIGQRSQSLSALQPAAVIQPRMAQLETLEAKMASIEVSLSSGTPRRKKCLGLTSASPVVGARVLNGSRVLNDSTTPHLEQLEGLRNALRDKENIIRSLRGQVSNGPVTNGSSIISNSTTISSGVGGLRGLMAGLHHGCRERELLTESERRHLEDRLQRLKTDTENKRLAIKNLKLALDKLDITDNIDVRIQQAELEYQLGREELNLLTILEEARTVQARLDESAAAVASRSRSGSKSSGGNGAITSTVHACVTELGGSAQLLALDTRWTPDSPRFGTTLRDASGDKGVWVDWAAEDTGLKKGDRLVEINGKLVISRNTTREDVLRLLSAAPDPAQLVVLRPGASQSSTSSANHLIGSGTNGEVAALRSELDLVRERAEEAQRAKDGLRADNLRLTHRISYLEEQVSELLESRRHRHHNHHNHSSHQNHSQHHQQQQMHQQDQQVRVVTSTAVNSTQNITNINIGAADVQVFQKGPQVTALVATSPKPPAPIRTPSSPCIAASDKYTTDEEQRPDSRRSTDIDEIRPSRRRADARSVKSLDLDSEPYASSTSHYAKPRKSLDYTSEPVSTSQTTRKRPTPPKKPIRLSLHRAQSLQSVENNLVPATPTTGVPSIASDSCTNATSAGRKRTHRGERSVSGLRWPQQSLAAVAVHLHQRQTARWC